MSCMQTELVVVGGGTMGAGIATSFLAAGRAVRLVESAPEFVEAAAGRVRDSLERMARKNEHLHVDELMERLELATGHDGDNDAVIAVIEAVPEDLELKRRLFEGWEPSYPADALLASNTSSLPIAQITGGLQHPERGIGMHFFNPVPVSSLVVSGIPIRSISNSTCDLSSNRMATSSPCTIGIIETRTSIDRPLYVMSK